MEDETKMLNRTKKEEQLIFENINNLQRKDWNCNPRKVYLKFACITLEAVNLAAFIKRPDA